VSILSASGSTAGRVRRRRGPARRTVDLPRRAVEGGEM